ncbi:hypothetical protein ZWY2020_026490 [Hordeum vulgare]|nr:hypothetical protein ZWY2020_026490 [Hordeum vulgare]
MAENRSESSMAAEWLSSIRRDLVQSVRDLLSAANDADLKDVCNKVSAAIAKPPPLGLGGDHRFLEREWVMLDDKKPVDGVGGRLFFHGSTGRFLLLPVPLLDEEDYILVGASDGLLILGDPKGLHPARLLNPFTGDLIPFAAPIPQESDVLAAVAGSSSSPTLLFSFQDWHGQAVVYCAEPTSPLCEVQFEGSTEGEFDLHSLLSYAGHFYVVDNAGGIFKVVGKAPQYRADLIAKTFDKNFLYYYLVESARELLLVTRRHDWDDTVEVFKVDTRKKLIEPL